MKELPKITADKEEKAELFFTTPLKLPRLKRSRLKSKEGYCPHIVFDENIGRWILKTDKV